MKKILTSCFEIDKLIQRFIAAWCGLNVFVMHQNPIPFTDIEYAFNVDVIDYAIALFGVFAFFSLLSIAFPKKNTDSWAMAVLFAAFSSFLLTVRFDFWLCLSLIILAAIMLVFLLKDDKLSLGKIKIGNKLTVAMVAVMAFVVFFVIALLTCLRYATYSSPNFDFGLFVNMFHHMKETGLPITSSERDKLLSHFAVHISPIYYLLLPLYFIFPSPYTLQISQALVLAGGILPLYLLAKHKGLSNKIIILLSVAYAFSPIIICGTSYDIHENCFLVPLLLWVFYFFEREKYLFMYIATFFVFCIKEDACLYIFFFGLFAFLSRKKYLHGIILAVVSVAYFVTAVSLLTRFGDGVLSNHYQNYMYEENGLIGMVRIILINPGYVFDQTLKVEKLNYIVYMLLPLGFMPLATRKVSHFILLLPFMLFNLMTTYVYQYSIDFQYNYGAITCMLYLFVINASELGERPRRYISSLAAVAAVMCSLVTVGPKLGAYIMRYNSSEISFDVMDSVLETIPDDASVKASTFLVPHIADRHEIYEVNSKNETDYIVFDMRPSLAHETEQLREYYLIMGYEVYEEAENHVLILKNPEAE